MLKQVGVVRVLEKHAMEKQDNREHSCCVGRDKKQRKRGGRRA